MKLVHLLHPKRIFLGLKAESLDEAIRQLVPLVVQEKPEANQKRLVEQVLERERLVSTMVGRGFALPHARSEEVSELVVGVGTFPDGLRDITPDSEQVKVVFLLLEPKRVSKLYLKTLGVLARLARIPGIMEKLTRLQTPEEFVHTVEQTGLMVTERLFAGDIARHMEPVRLGMTLKQVADLFFRNDTLTLPILDEKDNVVGIVRCSDLLEAAMPEYAKMIGNLSFLSEFEPFDQFLYEEDKIPVDKLVEESFLSADESAAIVEVTSLLLHHKENALVVLRDGRYYGMLSLRDIITKVMRT